tara:strand:+ start:1139 stop:1570 length:432 start_codon:yes stop_codon:yes gene_type:complete
MKDTLFWNNLHNQLRIAQGVPQPIPVYPGENSTAQEILDFTTDTIFHVANQTGSKQAVHLFVSSPVECTIFVRVISANMLTPNGTKTRLTSWPTTVDAMTFKIRPNQPSPMPIVQGYHISSGAAVSLMASQPGPRAFGFIVKE